MSNENGEAKILRGVEKTLAREQPFGDYRYIDERNWLQYEARLEMLAEYVPEAGKALAGLQQANGASRYRVLGDPVVRSVINTGLAHYKLDGPEVPLEELQAVLGIAARHLAENSRVAPLAVGAGKAKRLGRASYHGWIWCDEREEDLAAQSFRRLFYRQEGARSALWTPDEQGQRMLVAGTKLLSELLPELARSALNHLHLVVVLNVPERSHWGDERYCLPFDSFSTGIVLGTIFLSKTALRDPWRVAEYLLHEALHQKQHDFEHTHSVLRDGYDSESSPKIEAVWNRSRSDSTNEWPVCRALGAFHVYVHLALFFKVIERRAAELVPSYGSLNNLDPGLAARRAMDRAHYLGRELERVGDELGLAGHRFVDWLKEVLGTLDSQPAFDYPHAHMLDMYDSETDRLKYLIVNWSNVSNRYLHQSLLPSVKAQPERQIMLRLVESEMFLAQQVSALRNGSEPAAPSFLQGDPTIADALAQKNDLELASIFETARTYTYKSLRTTATDILSKDCPHQPGKTMSLLLSEIVESSGQCLDTYAHLPD